MIKRTITYKDLKIMLNLYKTLVRPNVEYCVSAWSPYYRACKLFNIRLYATLCFNYFR